MEVIPTRIPDVVIVQPKVFADERGYFLESWHAEKFERAGISANFVQDNHSHSRQWALRGLHYQIQQPQAKLVRVTRGRVFDVAVDLRRSSPTFGAWVGAELDDTNHRMLWVPEGFAHGFLVLSPTADFVYKCTDFYSQRHERGIRWDDPDIGIQWPLPPGVKPLLSARDASAASIASAECFT